jgi:hypothetical protein
VEDNEALPLLAYTLALLYRRSKVDKKLSLAEYEALGDAAGGLNPIQNSIGTRRMKRSRPSSHPTRSVPRCARPSVPHLVRVCGATMAGAYARSRAAPNCRSRHSG